MSQNDYTIANQSAPNFRSDLNNALQALASQSSGNSAPSTTYANQLWYDTANNILKMRSEADDDWINLFTITQSTGTSFPSEVPRVIDEDSFASNSSTRPPSQQSTKAYVDGLALGVGQEWQDFTASRSAGVSYQNTTGRPIMVGVRGFNNVEFQVSVDNTNWVNVGFFSNNASMSVEVVIPDTDYYRMVAGTLQFWSELR